VEQTCRNWKCNDCPAGKYNDGAGTEPCKSCSTREQDTCPDGSLVGCGGASAGECKVVPCPDGSEGENVKLGCTCREGFVGSIVPSDEEPYYSGQCFKVCDQCPAKDPEATQLYKTELQHGVDVLTGVRSSRRIFMQNAFQVASRTSSQTKKISTVSRSLDAVANEISREFGFDASASLSGSAPTKYGAISASLTATFSGTEASSIATSTLRENTKTFSWTSRLNFILEAAVSNFTALDAGFKQDVAALRVDDSFSTFRSLFHRYGTHYVESADIGAKTDFFMTVSTSFSSATSESFLSDCFSWAVEAGAAFEGVGGLGLEATGSYGETECKGESSSATTERFAEEAEMQHHAQGGITELLSCGEPSTRFSNYVSSPCLNDNNAEVFPNTLKPIWMLFRDAAPGQDYEVADAAEFYFFKYLTEKGTLLSGEQNPDRMCDSYATWKAHGKSCVMTAEDSRGTSAVPLFAVLVMGAFCALAPGL